MRCCELIGEAGHQHITQRFLGGKLQLCDTLRAQLNIRELQLFDTLRAQLNIRELQLCDTLRAQLNIKKLCHERNEMK